MTPIGKLVWVFPYVRKYRHALLGVMLLAAVTSAVAAIQPYFSKLIIDRGLIGRHYGLLVELCLSIIALTACGFALGALSRLLYVRLSGRILFAIREDIYAHLLTLPPRFFRTWPVGDLVTRLDGDVAEIQRFATDSLLAIVNGALLLGFSVAVMIAMSPALTLVAAGIFPFQLLLRYRAKRPIADSARQLRESRSIVAHFLIETLGAAKAVQSAGAENWERDRLGHLNNDMLVYLIRQQLIGYTVGALSGLLSHATTAAVFIYGGWQVMHGSLSVGTLIAYTAYLARSNGSATSLIGLHTAYQRVGVSLDRVRELRGAQPMRSSRHGSRPLTVRRGTIHFQQVSFRYPQGQQAVLQDLTIEIASGCKAVLFGESGVGKSTLVDLLRGFAEPDAGRVLIDSHEVSEYDLQSLRRRIPVLEPDPVLFRGTILENLRYGNFDAPVERIFEIAAQTGVDSFVSQLPQRYATELGSRGAGLSTGQRQRIAVARALLGTPFVLILDEATSNLDSAAVLAMHDLIDRQMPQSTRIVITHAPLSVPRAERLLEVRQGQCLEHRFPPAAAGAGVRPRAEPIHC